MNKTAESIEERIKNLFLSLGANVCGVANIEAFAEAPKGFSPIDIYPDCRSVVMFGVAMPKGTELVSPRLVYQRFNDESKAAVDHIAFMAAKTMEENFGCIAVPLPCDDPNDSWDAETQTAQGLISMKHAAVLAGLGRLGKSTLLLNPIYGNRLTIGAVLTDLALSTDAPCKEVCLPGCRICIDGCPSHAIQENGTVVQALCRSSAYEKNARGYSVTNCNACRARCPMRFGKPSKN